MTAPADAPAPPAAPAPVATGALKRLLSPRVLIAGSVVLLVSLSMIYGFRDHRGLRSFEANFNDQLRVILSPSSAVQDPRISILRITEDTLALFPYRSPVDREFLSVIIGLLDEAGAKAIGLDILIDQATELAKDQALIDAIRAFDGPVVTAWADARACLRPAQETFLAEFIDKSGAIAGFATVTYDGDGVVRRFQSAQPDTAPLSFPAAMLVAAGGEPNPSEGLVDWRRETADGSPAFQAIPAESLLNPQLPAVFLQGWFKDRLVMIGADLEQTDRHQTSLAVDPTISNRTSAGVLLHAHVLSQMLDQRVVVDFAVSSLQGALIVIALTLIGVMLGISSISLWVKLGGLAAAAVAYLALAVYLAGLGGPYIPVAPSLLGFGIAFGLGGAAEAFLSSREKQFIRQAFSHYLEPAMVDRLAKDRSSLRLGGERREISFIFTDVAGFTDMSEQLEPEVLAELLNEYFDGISDIIARNHGSIDKFIGDAVVALFGALSSEADHALNAVRCAEQMDEFAEEFRKRKAHLGLGVTRIGVHSGSASVGNFGGRRRFDYTAMGDAMNTAARLESINKALGTRVTVSAAARAAAIRNASAQKPVPELRPVGRVMLKGKAEPVEVWNLDRETSEQQRRRYEDAFETLKGPREAAARAFARLAELGAPDPLVILHARRLEAGETGDRIGG
ncbi:MAG: adenylate/guanylate cyclase domain-containing protein [Pseudomonadota bacterium]